jgi:hypothetical protein
MKGEPKANPAAAQIWESLSRGRRSEEIRFGGHYYKICEGRMASTVYGRIDDIVIELTTRGDRTEVYVFDSDGLPIFWGYDKDLTKMRVIDLICASRIFREKGAR